MRSCYLRSCACGLHCCYFRRSLHRLNGCQCFVTADFFAVTGSPDFYNLPNFICLPCFLSIERSAAIPDHKRISVLSSAGGAVVKRLRKRKDNDCVSVFDAIDREVLSVPADCTVR